jgi:hypothetical protein
LQAERGERSYNFEVNERRTANSARRREVGSEAIEAPRGKFRSREGVRDFDLIARDGRDFARPRTRRGSAIEAKLRRSDGGEVELFMGAPGVTDANRYPLAVHAGSRPEALAEAAHELPRKIMSSNLEG